ncbi:hypothetical protein BLD48_12480 [Exiguobacterium sp. KRL4]|uniref:hypothetical protein n=1 Tax=Exiguobacterium sp. KRL4 TaxID=1914536 RepID=UPI0008F857D4|nr:hypothetical protein [Exiguobacterium sp. KRL4]OIN66156.1 hypothetical protein BLD48_12480 [Exiguobacterium sp. KRL4]
MQAVAVSFDIQNSRAYPSKEQLLTDLRMLADQLNQAFPEALVPFQVKSGDSLLGVFNEYQVSYPLVLMLLHQPLAGYIGIGFGQYETLSTMQADEANGSAIIFAFEAQEAAKQAQNQIAFSGPPYLPTALLNGYIEMLYPAYFGKTDRQIELHRLMDQYPDATYEEIGLKMGFQEKDARMNVAKLVARSQRKQRRRLEKALVDALKQLQVWEAIG